MSATYIVNGVLIRERKNCYHSDEVKKSLHNEEPEKSSLVDPALETLDPTPDIHSLFLLYNDMFFGGVLGGCEVKWSPRMTSCAGVCSYEGRGGLCSIRLSKPLLIFRPRRDLVETLLHEMIHAYLFVTVRDRDRDGHGARFQYHMRRINEMAGTHITIYHKFFAEVANYKQHWWRCDGPCQSRRPYFGWVKRATNRAPGPNDFWWKQHQQCCGGKFIKVKEPDGYTGSKKTKSTNPNAGNNSISKKKDLLTRTSNPASSSSNSFSGKGYILGSSKESNTKKLNSAAGQSLKHFFQKKEISSKDSTAMSDVINTGEKADRRVNDATPTKFVFCPSCNFRCLESSINSHLDNCLS